MPLKINEELIASRIQYDIDECNNYYSSTIEPKLLERYEIFEASEKYYDKKYKYLSKHSKLTSSDVSDAIEWSLPSLMKIFFGSQDIFTIQGVTQEDDNNAKTMQNLINFQLDKKNPTFLIFYNWFKDSLITGLGVLKCSWDRSYRFEDVTDIVNGEQLQLLQNDGKIKIKSIEQVPETINLFKVSYTQKWLVKNQPKLENILVSDIRYSPDARTLEEAEFVSHRKVVNIDYLRCKEKEKVYKDVDKVIEKAASISYSQLEIQQNDYFSTNYRKEEADKARTKVEIYECYTRLDVDNSGTLTNLIVTYSNGIILRIEENHYGRHPFFDISPVINPYKVWGKGFADIIGPLQDWKTMIIRQVAINVALNNRPRMFIDDSAINPQDLIAEKEYVRVRGNPHQALASFPIQPLANWTMPLLEYIEGLKENRTGVTRYNQGIDASSLNKTATGVSMIMQASNQRLDLIARIFSETGVRNVGRFLVEMNQKFIDEETVVRITNEQLLIRPDDLNGDFDIAVSAGVGISTRETMIHNMQMLIQLYPQLLQLGIAEPKQVFNAVKLMLEELGIKNASDYIVDPEELAAKRQKAQMLQAQMQQEQMMQDQMRSNYLTRMQEAMAAQQGQPQAPQIENPEAMQQDIQNVMQDQKPEVMNPIPQVPLPQAPQM